MSTDGFALPTADKATGPAGAEPDLEAFTAGVGGLGAIVPGPVIDLDKSRRQRAEQRRQAPSAVRIGGQDYPLPPDLPLGVLDAFGRLSLGDMTGLADALRLLWPDELEEAPNPDLGKPIIGEPFGTKDERPTITVVKRSPARELMYEHGLGLMEFEELLGGAISAYGLEGGLPSS